MGRYAGEAEYGRAMPELRKIRRPEVVVSPVQHGDVIVEVIIILQCLQIGKRPLVVVRKVHNLHGSPVVPAPQSVDLLLEDCGN